MEGGGYLGLVWKVANFAASAEYGAVQCVSEELQGYGDQDVWACVVQGVCGGTAAVADAEVSAL